MTNVDILKGLFEGTDYSVVNKRGRNAKTFSVKYKDSILCDIDKTWFNYLDEDLVREVINECYSQSGQLKEIAKELEKEQQRLMKSTLRKDYDDEKILEAIHNARCIKAQLKEMKPALLYIKEWAYGLYQLIEVENKYFESL